jgi:hypothetical protein
MQGSMGWECIRFAQAFHGAPAAGATGVEQAAIVAMLLDRNGARRFSQAV